MQTESMKEMLIYRVLHLMKALDTFINASHIKTKKHGRGTKDLCKVTLRTSINHSMVFLNQSIHGLLEPQKEKRIRDFGFSVHSETHREMWLLWDFGEAKD